MLKNITNQERLNLTIENACSIPVELLQRITETDGSIKAVRLVLNSHYKPEYSALANTFIDDSIKEAIADNNLASLFADLKGIVHRFGVLHELGEMYADLNNKHIALTGQPLNFTSGTNVRFTTGNDALKTVEMAVRLYNLAKLTQWAYLGNSEKLDTFLLPMDIVKPMYEKAAKALDEKRLIDLVKRTVVEEAVDLIAQDDGNYAIQLSAPISRSLALYSNVLQAAA